jgi:hypothetical protein
MVPVLHTSLPVAFKVGVGLTVNVPEVLAVQPCADVTVTWYAPLLPGTAGLMRGF